MADISRTAREIGSLVRQRRAAAREAAYLAAPGAAAQGSALKLGARVLDLITGLEGIVVDARSDHIVITNPNRPAG